MDLAATSGLLRLLADPTRLRLLALIEREELTVAELAGVLRLAQPRVSTHLAKLKEAGLVRDRRAGVSAYYRWNAEADGKTSELVQALRASLDDTLIADDLRRLPTILAQRARDAAARDRRRPCRLPRSRPSPATARPCGAEVLQLLSASAASSAK